jgi:carbamoyl-phosphate synthase large subunit
MITASSLAMEVGFDKFKTAEFLKEKGLPFPKTVLAKSWKEIENFPVILKTKSGSGSKDIYKINSKEDFFSHMRKTTDDYIIQEFLSNDYGEFTCGVFRSTDKEIRTQIFKRELVGGFSGYGEVIENNLITNLLEEIAIKLDLLGSINVQLRMNENLPMVFEINPRFSSTVLFRHLFGFKDLEWTIKDKLGEDLGVYIKPKPRGKFYKGFNEYLIY